MHVILHNLATHKTPDRNCWLLRNRRFAALTTKKLTRTAHWGVKELAADIQVSADTRNESPHPVRLAREQAKEILERLAGDCAEINHDATA